MCRSIITNSELFKRGLRHKFLSVPQLTRHVSLVVRREPTPTLYLLVGLASPPAHVFDVEAPRLHGFATGGGQRKARDNNRSRTQRTFRRGGTQLAWFVTGGGQRRPRDNNTTQTERTSPPGRCPRSNPPHVPHFASQQESTCCTPGSPLSETSSGTAVIQFCLESSRINTSDRGEDAGSQDRSTKGTHATAEILRYTAFWQLAKKAISE